jgi:hypothetical protein
MGTVCAPLRSNPVHVLHQVVMGSIIKKNQALLAAFTQNSGATLV